MDNRNPQNITWIQCSREDIINPSPNRKVRDQGRQRARDFSSAQASHSPCFLPQLKSCVTDRSTLGSACGASPNGNISPPPACARFPKSRYSVLECVSGNRQHGDRFGSSNQCFPVTFLLDLIMQPAIGESARAPGSVASYDSGIVLRFCLMHWSARSEPAPAQVNAWRSIKRWNRARTFRSPEARSRAWKLWSLASSPPGTAWKFWLNGWVADSMPKSALRTWRRWTGKDGTQVFDFQAADQKSERTAC